MRSPLSLLLLDYTRDPALCVLLCGPSLECELQRCVLVCLFLSLLCRCDLLRRVAQHRLHTSVSLLVRQVHPLVRGARGHELQLHRLACARCRRLVAKIVQLRLGLRAPFLLCCLQLALELAPKLHLALTHIPDSLRRRLLCAPHPRLGGRELAAELQARHHVQPGRFHTARLLRVLRPQARHG